MTPRAHPAAPLAAAAAAYCELIEAPPGLALPDYLRALRDVVMNAYVEGARLPPTKHPLPERPPLDMKRYRAVLTRQEERLGRHAGYRGVFNPLDHVEEAGDYSLAVDLVDAWEDLAMGLLLWKRKPDDAHATWRESFVTHWGKHAADALRVLHHHVDVVFPTQR